MSELRAETVGRRQFVQGRFGDFDELSAMPGHGPSRFDQPGNVFTNRRIELEIEARERLASQALEAAQRQASSDLELAGLPLEHDPRNGRISGRGAYHAHLAGLR